MSQLNRDSNFPSQVGEASREQKFIEISPYARPRDAVQTSVDFYEAMRARRSIRTFSSESVERDVLLNAIKTAGTAPNGANCQPWFFALIESSELKDKIRKEAERVEELFYTERAPPDWLSSLEPLGTNAKKPYLSVAPALIAVFTRHKVSHILSSGPVKSYYPTESTGIAVGFLLTALHKVGLATLTHTPRPMNFLNDILGLDGTYRPYILIVAGYPKTPVLVPNIKRKSLSEICQVY